MKIDNSNLEKVEASGKEFTDRLKSEILLKNDGMERTERLIARTENFVETLKKTIENERYQMHAMSVMIAAINKGLIHELLFGDSHVDDSPEETSRKIVEEIRNTADYNEATKTKPFESEGVGMEVDIDPLGSASLDEEIAKEVGNAIEEEAKGLETHQGKGKGKNK